MSQVRENLKFSWIHHLRYILQKRRLGYLGKGVYIGERVQFMRFPGNISIGDDVIVKGDSRICSCNKNAKISIGDNTTLGYGAHIFASERIVIGTDCLIAPFVYIVDSKHLTSRGKKINEQPNITSPVLIGNDVWVATNSIIFSGVNISDGAVIAAHSVVDSDIPPYEIWGGVPARKIGERK